MLYSKCIVHPQMVSLLDMVLILIRLPVSDSTTTLKMDKFGERKAAIDALREKLEAIDWKMMKTAKFNQVCGLYI